MKGKMVSIFLTGILTFGVVSLQNSGYIGSQFTPSARIWVDKDYDSNDSNGCEEDSTSSYSNKIHKFSVASKSAGGKKRIQFFIKLFRGW